MSATQDETKGTDYYVFRARVDPEYPDAAVYEYLGLARQAGGAKAAAKTVVPVPDPDIEYVAVPVRNWSPFGPAVVVEWSELDSGPKLPPPEPDTPADAIEDGSK